MDSFPIYGWHFGEVAYSTFSAVRYHSLDCMHELHIQRAKPFSDFPGHTAQKCCTVLWLFTMMGCLQPAVFHALKARRPDPRRETSAFHTVIPVCISRHTDTILTNSYYHSSDFTSIWLQLTLMQWIENPNAFWGCVLKQTVRPMLKSQYLRR